MRNANQEMLKKFDFSFSVSNFFSLSSTLCTSQQLSRENKQETAVDRPVTGWNIEEIMKMNPGIDG